jgi:hypothetical protein
MIVKNFINFIYCNIDEINDNLCAFRRFEN